MKIHILVLVVSLVIAVYLFNFATEQSDEDEPGVLDSGQDYDFLMNDVNSVRFDSGGTRQYSLDADRLIHYPEPEYITLEMPDFSLYPPADTPWHVSAESGRIEEDGGLQQNKIELSNDVVVRHTDAAGQTVYIYTEFLEIFPDSRNLRTDRQVRVEAGGFRLTGTGMNADLNARTIEFLNNVRGHYE